MRGTDIRKRLLLLIPMVLGITFLSFALMHLAGSDAVLQKAESSGIALSQEVLEAQRAELGLDQPFILQYLNWLGRFLTGDMGTSYVSGKDVCSTFLSKLPATLLLTGTSLLLTAGIAIPLGILSAVKQNRFTDGPDPGVQFCGKQSSQFFCGSFADVFAVHTDPGIPRDCQGNRMEKRGSADAYPGHRHVGQISAPGAGGCAGRTEPGLGGRGTGQGIRFGVTLQKKCAAKLYGDAFDAGEPVGGKPSGRNGHCGGDFHVGWSGKIGGGCHGDAGLSHDPGICGMDGSDLCFD